MNPTQRRKMNVSSKNSFTNGKLFKKFQASKLCDVNEINTLKKLNKNVTFGNILKRRRAKKIRKYSKFTREFRIKDFYLTKFWCRVFISANWHERRWKEISGKADVEECYRKAFPFTSSFWWEKVFISFSTFAFLFAVRSGKKVNFRYQLWWYFSKRAERSLSFPPLCITFSK